MLGIEKVSSNQNKYLKDKNNKTGMSFNRAKRELQISSSSNKSCKIENYHIASKTDKVYSCFQKNYYLPPHLNASSSIKRIHYGQCKNWKVKDSFNKENYQNQYEIYQKRVQGLKRKKWNAHSHIKYLIEQDRPDPSWDQSSKKSIKVQTYFDKRRREKE